VFHKKSSPGYQSKEVGFHLLQEIAAPVRVNSPTPCAEIGPTPLSSSGKMVKLFVPTAMANLDRSPDICPFKPFKSGVLKSSYPPPVPCLFGMLLFGVGRSSPLPR